jgi:hypothetical protein
LRSFGTHDFADFAHFSLTGLFFSGRAETQRAREIGASTLLSVCLSVGMT